MHVFLHDAGVFFRHLAAVDFGALGIALAFQALRLVARTRAWRNIVAAAYPDTRVRWRSVLGAYLGGVGLNAITPARSGDVLKLFLVKHRITHGDGRPALEGFERRAWVVPDPASPKGLRAVAVAPEAIARFVD